MPLILTFYGLIVLALTTAEYKLSRGAQAWLKPLAAVLFILIAIFSGALYWHYGRWILAGLVACAMGDILLLSRDSETRFQLGMAAFAIGHILYICAFYSLASAAGISLLAVIPLIAGAVYFLWIKDKLPNSMRVPVALYSLIIIFMVAKSLGMKPLIIPLAAILFAISDMFVARDRFVDDSPKNALMITPLYFGAQALFALSAGLG